MIDFSLRPRLLSTTLTPVLFFLSVCCVSRCQGDESPGQIGAANELRLTTPKLPDNLPRVAKELNERFSAGVIPVENSAVYLVRLMGEDVFDAELRADSLAMLGVESLGADGPKFVYFEPYAANLIPGDKTKQRQLFNQLTNQFQNAYGSIWKASDYPALAKYFDENDAALDELVRITKMPSYYAPILTAEHPPSLIGASYSIERRLPHLGQCLSIRALRRFGEGNFNGTVTDLIACHHLANLLAKGSPLDVSIAKAHWLDSYAFQGEWSLIASGQLTADQAKQLQTEMQSLSPIAPSHTSADVGERMTLHQEIELLKDHDEALYAFFDWAPAMNAEQLKALRAANIDWNEAHKRADEIQDETVETLLISDRDQQNAEIDRLNKKLDQWRKQTDADETTLLQSLETDRIAGSRWLGEAIALALRTNIWQRLCTDRRGQVRRDLISVGLALEEYHRRHGYYPAKLADLSPEILASIPSDAHAEEPFTYVREDKQHVELISWGTNRENDAGKLFHDDVIMQLGQQ